MEAESETAAPPAPAPPAALVPGLPRPAAALAQGPKSQTHTQSIIPDSNSGLLGAWNEPGL